MTVAYLQGIAMIVSQIFVKFCKYLSFFSHAMHIVRCIPAGYDNMVLL